MYPPNNDINIEPINIEHPHYFLHYTSFVALLSTRYL